MKKEQLTTKERIRKEIWIISITAALLALMAILLNRFIHGDLTSIFNFALILAALALAAYSAGVFWKIHEDNQKTARKSKANTKIVPHSDVLLHAHSN